MSKVFSAVLAAVSITAALVGLGELGCGPTVGSGGAAAGSASATSTSSASASSSGAGSVDAGDGGPNCGTTAWDDAGFLHSNCVCADPSGASCPVVDCMLRGCPVGDAGSTTCVYIQGNEGAACTGGHCWGQVCCHGCYVAATKQCVATCPDGGACSFDGACH